jgi:thioredoxin-like negative regulator of GroEL
LTRSLGIATLPTNEDIALRLARAYVRSGQRAEAAELLRAALAWSERNNDKVEAANKLLQALDSAPKLDRSADAE